MFKLIPYQTGIWAEKYPALAQLIYEIEGVDRSNLNIAVHPANSLIYDNAYYGETEMEYDVKFRVTRESQVTKPVWIENFNDFPNMANGDYTIKSDAEPYTLFENFTTVDLSKVGANIQID